MKLVPIVLFVTCSAALSQPFYKAMWVPAANTNVAGYRILMGKESGKYTATNSVEGRLNNTATLSNAPPGVGYLVGIAYASDGTESMWSTPEVKWTNRAFAPKNFKLSAEIQAGRTASGPWSNMASLNIPLPPGVSTQQFYRSQLLLEEVP